MELVLVNVTWKTEIYLKLGSWMLENGITLRSTSIDARLYLQIQHPLLHKEHK